MPQVGIDRWAWHGEWEWNVSVNKIYEDTNVIKRKGLARESFAEDSGGAPRREGQCYPSREMYEPVHSVTLGCEISQVGNSHHPSWLLISLCGRNLVLETAEPTCSRLHEWTCLAEDPGCWSQYPTTSAAPPVKGVSLLEVQGGDAPASSPPTPSYKE